MREQAMAAGLCRTSSSSTCGWTFYYSISSRSMGSSLGLSVVVLSVGGEEYIYIGIMFIIIIIKGETEVMKENMSTNMNESMGASLEQHSRTYHHIEA